MAFLEWPPFKGTDITLTVTAALMHSRYQLALRILKLHQKMDAITSSFKIILGSSSSPRREVLANMGYEFTIMPADIDEKSIRKEKPEDLVMALAEAKAEAIVERLNNGLLKKDSDQTTLLITCDQVVVCEGIIREKPLTKEEAREFIKGYSGSYAATVSSVLVTNLKSGCRKGEWEKAEIHFHTIPDQIIEDLIEEGMVLKVAGGLLTEHPSISPYIKEVVGTTDSLMGLPSALTERLIKEVCLAE